MPENEETFVREFMYGDDKYDLDELIHKARSLWSSHALTYIPNYNKYKKEYDEAFEDFTNGLDRNWIIADKDNDSWNVSDDINIKKFTVTHNFNPYGYVGTFYKWLIQDAKPYLSEADKAKKKQEANQIDWDNGKGVSIALYRNLFNGKEKPIDSDFNALSDSSRRKEVLKRAFESLDFDNTFKGMDNIDSITLDFLKSYRDTIILAIDNDTTNNLELYELNLFGPDVRWDKLFMEPLKETASKAELAAHDKLIDVEVNNVITALILKYPYDISKGFTYSYPLDKSLWDVSKTSLNSDNIGTINDWFKKLGNNIDSKIDINGLQIPLGVMLISYAEQFKKLGDLTRISDSLYEFPINNFNVSGKNSAGETVPIWCYVYDDKKRSISKVWFGELALESYVNSWYGSQPEIAKEILEKARKLLLGRSIVSEEKGGHIVRSYGSGGYSSLGLKDVDLLYYLDNLDLNSLTAELIRNNIINGYIAVDPVTGDFTTNNPAFKSTKTNKNGFYYEDGNLKYSKENGNLHGFVDEMEEDDAYKNFFNNRVYNNGKLTTYGENFFRANSENFSPGYLFDNAGKLRSRWSATGTNAIGEVNPTYNSPYELTFGNKEYKGQSFNGMRGPLHNVAYVTGDQYIITDEDGVDHMVSADDYKKALDAGAIADTSTTNFDRNNLVVWTLNRAHVESSESDPKGEEGNTEKEGLVVKNEKDPFIPISFTAALANAVPTGNAIKVNDIYTKWDRLTPYWSPIPRFLTTLKYNKDTEEEGERHIPPLKNSVWHTERLMNDLIGEQLGEADLASYMNLAKLNLSVDSTLNFLTQLTSFGKGLLRVLAARDASSNTAKQSMQGLDDWMYKNMVDERDVTWQNTLNIVNDINYNKNLMANYLSNKGRNIADLFKLLELLSLADIALRKEDQYALNDKLELLGQEAVRSNWKDNILEPFKKSYMARTGKTEALLINDPVYMEQVAKINSYMLRDLYAALAKNYKGYNIYEISNAEKKGLENALNEVLKNAKSGRHGGRLVKRKFKN